MSRHWIVALMAGAALALNGCALFKKTQTQDQASADVIPAEAGTDAVPAGQIETPQANTASSPTADTNTAQQQTASAESQALQQQIDAPPAQPAATETTPTVQPPAPAAPQAQASDTAGSGQFEDYKFQQGDTLMRVAFDTYGDVYKWRKIYSQNKDRIHDPNHVPPGTVIRLEKMGSPVEIERNGEKYMIKTGDTLGTISGDVYGTKAKWKRLWENNRQLIKDPNKIFAGFYLYYTMTPQDRQELEQLKGNQASPSQQLSQNQGDKQGAAENRAPASDSTAPAAPGAPAAAAAPAAPAAPSAVAPDQPAASAAPAAPAAAN